MLASINLQQMVILSIAVASSAREGRIQQVMRFGL